jgi:hypothetical protein
MLCALACSACLSQRLTAAEVIHDTQKALSATNSCHLVLDIELNTDLVQDTISVEVWEQGETWRRIHVLAAVNPQLQGLDYVTDGQQSMLYSPDANQVLLGPADLVRMPLVVESLTSGWREWMQAADPTQAKLMSREREEGLVVYKVEIPISPYGSAQYWIDARQWWISQVTYQEEYLGEGEIRIRTLDPLPEDAAGPPNVQSALDIPDGVPIKEVTVEDNQLLTLEEAQLAISFPLRTPTFLPSGTAFSAAYQLDKNIALVYAGEHSFTLVQGPQIGSVPSEKAELVSLRGRQATIVHDEEHGGTVLIWQEDGLQFSIAGSLDEDQVIRIAESLEQTFKSAPADENVQPVDRQGQ